jgi:integrase
MAWQRVEAGIYRGISRRTGKLCPALYVKYSVRGTPVFESAKTRDIKKARLYRTSKLLGAARGEPLGASRLTVGDLLTALAVEYEANDKLTPTKRAHLALFWAAFGKVHPADLVTVQRDLIVELRSTWKRAGVTNATINRRFNVLRRALRLAQQKGKIAVAPLIGRLTESHSLRGRYLPPEVADRIEAELPGWVAGPFRTAYSLGIRKGQLVRTRRDDVDLTRDRECIVWQPAETKNDDPHAVPLRGRALEIVRAALAVVPLGCPYVFHGPRCQPGRVTKANLGCVGDWKTAMANACRRAGVVYGRKQGGYTFHSTRHAATTNLHATMDEGDVMRITGHKTAAVFRRTYDHLHLDVLGAKYERAEADLARRLEGSQPGTPAPPRRRLRPVAAAGRLQVGARPARDGRGSVEAPPPRRLHGVPKSAK